MAYGRRWKPSKTAAREFAQTMDEIRDFCIENHIDQSRNGDSYYFTIDGQSYRVSNHTVEASNRAAYSDEYGQIRDVYHPDGRKADVIYIHAGKTRIREIYNDLKNGYELDGKGYRKEGRE